MPKILHFEDDTIIASIYRAKFEKEGFQAVSYTDPTKDPVTVVLKEHPDLILMDLAMPVMDGFEATRLLKGDARTKEIPLVILTSQYLQENINLGMKLGAADYLSKATLTPREVVEKVKHILGVSS